MCRINDWDVEELADLLASGLGAKHSRKGRKSHCRPDVIEVIDQSGDPDVDLHGWLEDGASTGVAEEVRALWVLSEHEVALKKEIAVLERFGQVVEWRHWPVPGEGGPQLSWEGVARQFSTARKPAHRCASTSVPCGEAPQERDSGGSACCCFSGCVLVWRYLGRSCRWVADTNWTGLQISLAKVTLVNHRRVPQASRGRHRAAGRNGPSQARQHVGWAASVIPCLENGEFTTVGSRSTGRSHAREHQEGRAHAPRLLRVYLRRQRVQVVKTLEHGIFGTAPNQTRQQGRGPACGGGRVAPAKSMIWVVAGRFVLAELVGAVRNSSSQRTMSQPADLLHGARPEFFHVGPLWL